MDTNDNTNNKCSGRSCMPEILKHLATSKNPHTKKQQKNKTNQKHTPKENPCNFKATCFVHKLYLFEKKKFNSVKTIYANLSSRCLTNRLFQYRKVSPPAKM